MRIYLIGYMGCGKTFIGASIARLLNFEFVDLDEYIEKRQLCTISKIFEEAGEKKFREIENKALQKMTKLENVVVATGGGTPCFYDNMDIMNGSGLTIYIAVNAYILANRLANSEIERPLIKGKSHKNLIKFIEKTIKTREPFYDRAKIKISGSDNLTAEEVIDKINEHASGL